jgi:transposase-like protein
MMEGLYVLPAADIGKGLTGEWVLLNLNDRNCFDVDYAPVLYPTCGQDDVVKHGRSGEGKQRYKCQNQDCPCKTFILDPTYRGRLSNVKQSIIDMAMNGSGIRDTARVLQISPKTVMSELKKSAKTASR